MFFSNIKTDKYKTARLSVNFALPLNEETATDYSLVFAYLRMNSRKFSSFIDLNKKLSDLYGAALYDDTAKIGDMQVLSLATNFLCGSSVNSEEIQGEVSNLLLSILFEPKIIKNAFLKEEMNTQRENLKEEILSEINDKRRYALRRSIEILFENQPFSVSSVGNIDKIYSSSEEKLYERYQNILKTAVVEIVYDGPDNTEIMEKRFSERFSDIIDRNPIKIENSNLVKISAKSVSENMEVGQAKEVIIYSLPNYDFSIFRVMSSLFGGNPFSMLFRTVREEKSLCYYCSSSLVKSKNIMLVESGVDNAKTEETYEAITEELDKLKNGEFSDEALIDTKKYLISGIRTIEDSPGAFAGRYLSSLFLNEPLENEAQRIESVTKEDVVKAANGIELQLRYCLKGGVVGE